MRTAYAERADRLVVEARALPATEPRFEAGVQPLPGLAPSSAGLRERLVQLLGRVVDACIACDLAADYTFRLNAARSQAEHDRLLADFIHAESYWRI